MTKKDIGAEASKRPSGRPVVGASRPVVDQSSLPEGKRRVLAAVPKRTIHEDLKWSRNKRDGLYVLKLRKNFTRFERALRKIAGGPEWVRLPLDRPGSRIWELCDGKHTILQIGRILDKEFKEELEPVLPRLVKFLELLLKKNLIVLVEPSKVSKDEKGPGPGAKKPGR